MSFIWRKGYIWLTDVHIGELISATIVPMLTTVLLKRTLGNHFWWKEEAFQAHIFLRRASDANQKSTIPKHTQLTLKASLSPQGTAAQSAVVSVVYIQRLNKVKTQELRDKLLKHSVASRFYYRLSDCGPFINKVCLLTKSINNDPTYL